MLRFIYNLFLPVGFLFFIPGLWFKYRNRGGYKATFGERFGHFKPERLKELADYHGAVWIHAVSVGEAVVALNMLKQWQALEPQRKFVISTTTTTGQELVRNQLPPNTAAIFAPIDFIWMVRKALKAVRPSLLVIFETEIWPNLVWETRRSGVPVSLVNGRMSDRSARGYRRARIFFGPLLRRFNLISVQTEADAERYKTVSPRANVITTGNLKFDQSVPAELPDPEYAKYFGPGKFDIILGASTHAGEEALIAETCKELLPEFPQLRLVLVPRHAERGNDIAEILRRLGLSFVRRSTREFPEAPVQALLADTTGEMLRLMSRADIVIMGKSLAGHDEGHNLIEPALLNKPIVTGHVLRNFRFIQKVLLQGHALVSVISDSELKDQLRKLLADRALREELGRRAGDTIRRHAGATGRTIRALQKLLTTE